MLQSLRARLAFLFAGTLVLATVTAAVVVVSLYQSYNRDQTTKELRAQVGGLQAYYQLAYDERYVHPKLNRRAPSRIDFTSVPRSAIPASARSSTS